MKYIKILIIFLILVFIVIFWNKLLKNKSIKIQNININLIQDSKNWLLDKKYTCDWENMMPSMAVPNIPNWADSFVLVVKDNSIWTWKIIFLWWNYKILDSNNIISLSWFSLDSLGINDFRTFGRSWPCPWIGDDAHKYSFEVFAIKWYLTLIKWSDITMLNNAMKKSIVWKWIYDIYYKRILSNK